MKIHFHILHTYTINPLKAFANALHLTLQDDLLIQIDLETTLSLIKIKLNKRLPTASFLTVVELDIDSQQYDMTNYDIFIENLHSKLSAIDGFQKLLKYTDDVRMVDYLNYYQDIADLEMKIREVFSYIFYYRYSVNGSDLFDEFDAKTAGSEEPKSEELEKRLENKFFYLTFNGYLKFERPKDVSLKELLPLIQSNEQYEQLRNHLNSRGITTEHHIDFFQAVKTILVPIESVRNCIAHNRQIPNKAEQNYRKAKDELNKHIEEFWQRELEDAERAYEVNFAEEYAYERLNNLLSVSEWKDFANEIVVHDHWATGTPSHTFTSLEDLKEFLISEADITAHANFPSNEEDKQDYLAWYDGKTVVDKALRKYEKNLVLMNWV